MSGSSSVNTTAPAPSGTTNHSSAATLQQQELQLQALQTKRDAKRLELQSLFHTFKAIQTEMKDLELYLMGLDDEMDRLQENIDQRKQRMRMDAATETTTDRRGTTLGGAAPRVSSSSDYCEGDNHHHDNDQDDHVPSPTTPLDIDRPLLDPSPSFTGEKTSRKSTTMLLFGAPTQPEDFVPEPSTQQSPHRVEVASVGAAAVDRASRGGRVGQLDLQVVVTANSKATNNPASSSSTASIPPPRSHSAPLSSTSAASVNDDDENHRHRYCDNNHTASSVASTTTTTTAAAQQTARAGPLDAFLQPRKGPLPPTNTVVGTTTTVARHNPQPDVIDLVTPRHKHVPTNPYPASHTVAPTASLGRTQPPLPPPPVTTIVDPNSRYQDDRNFPWSDRVQQLLHDTFHLTTFRDHQKEIIHATLSGEDVFVVMRTGGGKSLTYQLPSLLEGRGPHRKVNDVALGPNQRTLSSPHLRLENCLTPVPLCRMPPRLALLFCSSPGDNSRFSIVVAHSRSRISNE